MTVQASARARTATSEPCVVLTPSKGSAEALTLTEAWDLMQAIRNAVLRLEREDRETTLATTVRAARATERKLRRAAKVDEQLREKDAQ